MVRIHHFKKGLLCSLFVVMALIWFIFGITKHWISYSQKSGLSRQYDSQSYVGFESQRSFIFSDSKGHLYKLWCDYGIVFQYCFGIPIPIGNAKYVVPTNEGVAYKANDGQSQSLYIFQNFHKKKIEGDYTDIAWDGKQIILFNADTGKVFSYNDGNTELLCQTMPQTPGAPCFSFLASNHWIVVGRGEERNGMLQVYDRYQNESKTIPVYGEPHSIKVFLSDETLVIVGGYYENNTLTIIELASNETRGFDLGMYYGEEAPINASAVLNEDQSTLFISVASDPVPKLSYARKQSMTIAIDLNDNTYEKLNDTYYASMFLNNDELYGIKNGIIFKIKRAI